MLPRSWLSHPRRDQGDTGLQPAPAQAASPPQLHLLPTGLHCQDLPCWGSAGAAGRHQKVSRLVGAGTGLPRFPCSGPCGHRSCCSASVMLFQPLFALHCLLYLFFCSPLHLVLSSFPLHHLTHNPWGVFTHHHRLRWPKASLKCHVKESSAQGRRKSYEITSTAG